MNPREITIVESFDDLDGHRILSGCGSDMVATLLSEGVQTVVHIPVWLVEDKRVETVTGGGTLAVGTVEDYSEKAWQFVQNDEQPVFLPKSQVHVFRAGDVDGGIETPQSSLHAFQVGGER